MSITKEADQKPKPLITEDSKYTNDVIHVQDTSTKINSTYKPEKDSSVGCMVGIVVVIAGILAWVYFSTDWDEERRQIVQQAQQENAIREREAERKRQTGQAQRDEQRRVEREQSERETIAQLNFTIIPPTGWRSCTQSIRMFGLPMYFISFDEATSLAPFRTDNFQGTLSEFVDMIVQLSIDVANRQDIVFEEIWQKSLQGQLVGEEYIRAIAEAHREIANLFGGMDLHQISGTFVRRGTIQTFSGITIESLTYRRSSGADGILLDINYYFSVGNNRFTTIKTTVHDNNIGRERNQAIINSIRSIRLFNQ